MATFEATPAQKQAIDTRNSAVLVSAAAGSGKTKVITERILSYLMDEKQEIGIDQFLIITFTKAAAGELRSRISGAIEEQLQKNPTNSWLKRQSVLCQRADIGTIHSFCQSVLKEHCHVLGISPDFKIADEDRARLMKQSALERALETRYEDMDGYPGFETLVNTVGAGRDDSKLVRLAMSVYEKMQCHADPEKWAREQIAEFEGITQEDVGKTIWGEELLKNIKDSTRNWVREFDELILRMHSDDNARIAEAYGESIETTRDALRNFSSALDQGWESARAVAEIPYPKLKTLRNSPDEELSTRIKEEKALCKKWTDRNVEIFSKSSEESMTDLKEVSSSMKALLELVMGFKKEYQTAKTRAGLVDFSDLEHFTVQLLTDEDGERSAVAADLSKRYHEIMVDEYQDVSRVQEHIFNAISRDRKNLFLVGDVKQSIYRFRLADPGIFISKFEGYPDFEKAADEEPRKILLQENFRSRQEIVNAVNQTFGTCMSNRVGELVYDEKAALHFGATYYEDTVPPPEIMLLGERASKEDAAWTKERAEAEMVADRIQALADPQKWNETEEPHYKYSDIAVLLRSANAIGKVYQQVFTSRGIPVSSDSGTGFFSTAEVSTVMALLSVIDNPYQDVELVSVLHSPVFDFSPDDLTAIRMKDLEGSFYEALDKSREEIPQSGKFIDTIKKYRMIAPDMEISEFLWKIYSELNLIAVFSAMPNGEARRKNLLSLLDCTRMYEQTGYRGVHRFIRWFHSMEERGEVPSTGIEEDKGVRIMSVHKSKGLEFPVVFLCDTGRQFNKQDAMEPVLVHPELGLGPKVTEVRRHISYPTVARMAIRDRLNNEAVSEEMRLLYVAMTRAKERLFVSAYIKDIEKEMKKIRSMAVCPLNPEIAARVSSPVKWILYAACADPKESMLIRVAEVKADKGSEPPENNDAANDIQKEIVDTIRKRVEYRYPYYSSQKIPSKVTATELKRRRDAMDAESAAILPKPPIPFAQDPMKAYAVHTKGAREGTANHAALQLIDLKTADSLEAVHRQVTELAGKGRLSAEDLELIDEQMLWDFCRSDLGRRMANADKLYREFNFTVMLPSKYVIREGNEEEVLMQGAIDCWFEENGEVVVVDYKTDRVDKSHTKERSKQYEQQISCYTMALEEITGKAVKEAFIYFLRPQKAENIEDFKSLRKDLQ